MKSLGDGIEETQVRDTGTLGGVRRVFWDLPCLFLETVCPDEIHHVVGVVSPGNVPDRCRSVPGGARGGEGGGEGGREGKRRKRRRRILERRETGRDALVHDIHG